VRSPEHQPVRRRLTLSNRILQVTTSPFCSSKSGDNSKTDALVPAEEGSINGTGTGAGWGARSAPNRLRHIARRSSRLLAQLIQGFLPNQPKTLAKIVCQGALCFLRMLSGAKVEEASVSRFYSNASIETRHR
jgi:hypothetical protein